MSKPKAAVIMGSDSDFPVVKKCLVMLKKFGIEAEVSVISAHRTPELAAQYAKHAEENGVEVIIAAAGKAGASGRRFGGVYHAAGHRYPHQIVHDGRHGFPAFYGTDAEGYPGCDGRH